MEIEAQRAGPTYNFMGQVALVTGAGSGMGLATAQAFAAAGAAVVIADVNQKALLTAHEVPGIGQSRSRVMSRMKRK